MEPKPPIAGPENVDRFLAELRQGGASAIDAIKAVRERQNVSLGDVKWIVLNSPAWSDAREEHTRLIDEILAALESE